MPEERLLEQFETAGEKPFLLRRDLPFIHTPLREYQVRPDFDGDESNRLRVALFGQFAIAGQDLYIPQIITNDEQAMYGLDMCRAHTAFLEGIDYIKNRPGYDIPIDEVILNEGLPKFREVDDVELMAGIQVFCDEDGKDFEPVLVVNHKLYANKLTFEIGSVLLRQITEDKIAKNLDTREIMAGSRLGTEFVANSAAVSLMVQAREKLFELVEVGEFEGEVEVLRTQ